jgi:hypothetical protein
VVRKITAGILSVVGMVIWLERAELPETALDMTANGAVK